MPRSSRHIVVENDSPFAAIISSRNCQQAYFTRIKSQYSTTATQQGISERLYQASILRIRAEEAELREQRIGYLPSPQDLVPVSRWALLAFAAARVSKVFVPKRRMTVETVRQRVEASVPAFAPLAIRISTSQADCEAEAAFAAVYDDQFSVWSIGEVEFTNSVKTRTPEQVFQIITPERKRHWLRGIDSLDFGASCWGFPSRSAEAVSDQEQCLIGLNSIGFATNWTFGWGSSETIKSMLVRANTESSCLAR